MEHLAEAGGSLKMAFARLRLIQALESPHVPGHLRGRKQRARAIGLVVLLVGATIGVWLPPTQGQAGETVGSGRVDFYVAPNGRDDWSGRLPEPRSDGRDGPFATLRRARDAVRQLLRRETTRSVIVQIRGGIYRLSETIVFSVEDSGRRGPVRYEAYPGEKPVFSGGVEIAGWEPLTNPPPALREVARGKVWVTSVPRLEGRPWRFFTLYDSRGMLPSARSTGFVPELPPAGRRLAGGEGAKTVLHFPPGRLKNWPNLSDVELVIRPFHAWVLNILPLAHVDEGRRVARTQIPGTYPLLPLRFLPDTPSCWVENTLEVLDEPGEWVLDTASGKLYLWPREPGPRRGLSPRDLPN